MPIARKYQINWLPDNYYHIYNRGAHKVPIFREEQNYVFVLSRTKQYLRKFDVAMIAYCLLPIHYHFLVRQQGDYPAGLIPQRIFNSYSKAYNRRYEHSGTLFEGRYQAVHVVKESHLRQLCRYIHANPLKHGVVDDLEKWPYSNYLEWIGLRPGELVDHEFVDTFFPNRSDYREFVDDYLTLNQVPEELTYLT